MNRNKIVGFDLTWEFESSVTVTDRRCASILRVFISVCGVALWSWLQRWLRLQSWLTPQSPHRLRYELKCVKWDVKPYHTNTIVSWECSRSKAVCVTVTFPGYSILAPEDPSDISPHKIKISSRQLHSKHFPWTSGQPPPPQNASTENPRTFPPGHLPSQTIHLQVNSQTFPGQFPQPQMLSEHHSFLFDSIVR